MITVSQSLLDTCTASTCPAGIVLDASGAPHTFVVEAGAWVLRPGTTGRTIDPREFPLLQHATAEAGGFRAASGAWYALADHGSTVACEAGTPPPPPPPP